MTKFYHLFTLLLVAMLAAPVAKADIEVGAMQFDQIYAPGLFQWVTGTLTVDKDQTIRVWGTQGQGDDLNAEPRKPYAVKIAPTGTTDYLLADTSLSYYDFYGEEFDVQGYNSYDIKANVTYDVAIRALSGRVVIESMLGAKLKLNIIEPAPGDVAGKFSNGGNGQFYLGFNFPMPSGTNPDGTEPTAYIEWNGVQKPLLRMGNAVSTSLTFGSFIRDADRNFDIWDDLFNKGMKAGDPLKLVVKNIQAVNGMVLGEDGTLEVEYVAQDAPYKLVRTQPGNISGFVLNSYMPTDSDEGLFKFIFEGPLDEKKCSASIQLGDLAYEDGGIHEWLPVSVEDNTLIVDMRGKDRKAWQEIYEKTISEVNPNPTILFGVTAVGANGVPTLGAGYGAVGSYHYAIHWGTVIEPIELTYEWEPMPGSDIRDLDTVGVWVLSSTQLTMEGMQFLVADENEETGYLSVIVPFDEMTVKQEDEDSAVFSAAIPAQVKGKGDVQVSLHKLYCTGDFAYHTLQTTYVCSEEETDGIEGVTVDGGATRLRGVYNAMGQKVANSAANLPAGLYIIDGVKTLVK